MSKTEKDPEQVLKSLHKKGVKVYHNSTTDEVYEYYVKEDKSIAKGSTKLHFPKRSIYIGDANGVLGNKSQGNIDFLTNHCGYKSVGVKSYNVKIKAGLIN